MFLLFILSFFKNLSFSQWTSCVVFETAFKSFSLGLLKECCCHSFSSRVLIHTHNSSVFHFPFNTIIGFCIKILTHLLWYLYLHSIIWYWFTIFVLCWGLNLSHLTHDVSSLPACSCFWWHLPRSLILLIVEGIKNKIDFRMSLSLYPCSACILIPRVHLKIKKKFYMQIFSPDNKVLFFFPASGLSSHVSLSWLGPLVQWRMQWWELTSCLLVSEGRVFCYKFDVSVDSVFACLFVFFGRGLFMKLKLYFFSFSLKRILKMVIIWFYHLLCTYWYYSLFPLFLLTEGITGAC